MKPTLRAVAMATFVACTAPYARAQSTLSPFADAVAVRAERGEAASATLRLRYELTETHNNSQPHRSELELDVASD